MNNRARLLIVGSAALALSLVPAALPAVSHDGHRSSWAEQALGLLGVGTANAVWGVARRGVRRTARRTSRRTSRRQAYIHTLPVGAAATVVAGTTYYVVGTTYYVPVMVEGQVAYQPTAPPPPP